MVNTNFCKTRVAALALLACAISSTGAQTPADSTSPLPEQPVQSTPDSEARHIDRVFTDNNPSSGPNQLSTTSIYELGGIGRRGALGDPNILTAPVLGLPVRFDNGIFVYPAATAGVGHNDNVLATSTGRISSTLYSLQPDIVAELKKSGDRYTLNYRGNYTRYDNSGSDNFYHHELGLAGDNYFTVRNRLGWSANYMERTDPRGFTDRPLSTEPDRWNAQVARLLYIYGATGAIGRIEVDASATRKRYENNRVVTELADLDQFSMTGRFFYRVAPRTSAVFTLRRIVSNYTSGASVNDNNDTRALVGVTWDASAKTSGTVKLGYQQKDFSSPGMPSAKGATWEGSVRWSPRSYSVVDVVASRAAADATGLGNYIWNNGVISQWSHRWSSVLSSRLNLGKVRTTYAGIDRTDDTWNGGIGVFYDLSHNLRGGLEWSRIDRSSNIAIYDFRRNVLFLSLEGKL